MKRHQMIAFIAAWAVLGSGVAFAQETTWPTKPFTDVPANSTHYTAIEYLRQQKVLKGYLDDTFRPRARINRAEMVKLIANPFILDTSRLNDCMTENMEADDMTVFYPDASRDSWYTAELCLTHTKKIISGYPDGTFQPGNYINFVEAAKVIVSTFSLQTSTDEMGARWFMPYVNSLSSRGAIPTSITRFDQIITRGEMAEMIYRIKADKGKLDANTTSQLK